jgi:MFS family permease
VAECSLYLSQVLVNTAAPTREALGTLNGAAQAASSLMRAIGPATATSLFALSVRHGGGVVVFWVLAVVACITLLSSFFIRELQTAAWRSRGREGEGGEDRADGYRATTTSHDGSTLTEDA